MLRGAMHYMKVERIDLLVVGLPVAAFKAKKRAALERLVDSDLVSPEEPAVPAEPDDGAEPDDVLGAETRVRILVSTSSGWIRRTHISGRKLSRCARVGTASVLTSSGMT